MIFISDSWLTDLDLEIILDRFDVSDAFSHVSYFFLFADFVYAFGTIYESRFVESSQAGSYYI